MWGGVPRPAVCGSAWRTRSRSSYPRTRPRTTAGGAPRARDPRAGPHHPKPRSTTRNNDLWAHSTTRDEPPGALDRTANETVEDSDAFVSGDDAGVQVSARGGIAGPGGTGANGEASGTDGEFVSGADTDTGIDRGLPRAPRRLKTLNAVNQVLLQEEDAMATPLSPGTMLNEAWELAMGGDDDATREFTSRTPNPRRGRRADAVDALPRRHRRGQ